MKPEIMQETEPQVYSFVVDDSGKVLGRGSASYGSTLIDLVINVPSGIWRN